MEHEGARQMGHLRAFFEKVEWQKLEPRDELLTEDKGEKGSRMLAMMNPEGSLAVVYNPHGKPVHVDLRVMKAWGAGDATLKGEWFNPRTGKSPARTSIKGPVQNPAKITFYPGQESGRDNDWVLTLRIERK
jgi:hypothetical protein